MPPPHVLEAQDRHGREFSPKGTMCSICI